jgi:hypothetical protein
MRIVRLVAIAMVATAALNARAQADETEATADARCMVVAFSMGRTSNVSLQTASLMAVYYYLGRLDGLSPKPDLEALLAQEATRMTPADLKAEALRCGSELTERGKQIQLMGQHLVELGK